MSDTFMDSQSNMFDVVSGLRDRRVVLFGSGNYAKYYMEKYGGSYVPDFIVDNDREQWYSRKYGLEIRNPEEIQKLDYGTYCVVIAVNNYVPVVEQLERMDVEPDSYRVVNRELDVLAMARVGQGKDGGKYEVGYVTGVFDLFHIGHLNLLQNCKTRCHYLIAGVLTNELTEQDKHKKPFIPFAERMEIVRQCKYVDRVIPVSFQNTDKIDAWKALRYGCLFAGSDHEGERYWLDLRQKLRYLGAELEFFPYTKSTSSTMLQRAIGNRM